MTTAKEIMNDAPLTVLPDTKISDIAEKLADRGYGGAIALNDDGTVAGVITVSDLISQHKNLHLPTVITLFESVITLGGAHDLDDQMKKMLGSTVADIMTTDVTTVEEDTPLQDIASIMIDEHKHVIPVVRAGGLVGVIDRAQLIRAIVNRSD